MTPKHTLEIKSLYAGTKDKKIIKNLSLKINSGEIHVIMGRNGSGKSTLLNVLMGHPKYEIEKGQILLNRKNITKLSPDKKAEDGLFMSFQHPIEIPGVSLTNFLRTAKNSITKKHISPIEFLEQIKKYAKLLKMTDSQIERSINQGFSGGEKKKSEILQMAILEPKFALLDEIDSGLDIDALKSVANAIKEIFKKTKMGLLLITHYQRILNYITPDFVHIIHDGKIIKSGGKTLARELEKNGYEKYISKK